MIERPSSPARWDERIQRARGLVDVHTAASEALRFYAELAEYQKSLLGGSRRATFHDGTLPPDVSFVDALGVDRALDAIPDLLSWLSRAAPLRLTEAIRDMRAFTRGAWHD